MSLVAWLLRDDYTERAEVVFAHTQEEAAEASEFEIDPDIVERAPAYDRFSPGPVPISDLLDDGWWWTCGYCGHDVHGDGCDECADERGSDVNAEPVINDERCEVYCSQACADAEAAERMARKEREESARRRCREALALWPDADLGRFWPTMNEGEGFFHARLPGLKYSVTWEEKDPMHVYVHPDDVAEYQRIRDERRARSAEKELRP